MVSVSLSIALLVLNQSYESCQGDDLRVVKRGNRREHHSKKTIKQHPPPLRSLPPFVYPPLVLLGFTHLGLKVNVFPLTIRRHFLIQAQQVLRPYSLQNL